jgi:hypothetical protein
LIFFLPSSRLLSTATLSPSGNGIGFEPGSTAGLFKVVLMEGVKAGGIETIALLSGSPKLFADGTEGTSVMTSVANPSLEELDPSPNMGNSSRS